MIAYDSFGESNTAADTAAGNATFSFNNVGGSFLLAAVMSDVLTETVTTVSYNGVNLTQLYKDVADTITKLWVGYLQNPATGSHDITVNFTGGVSAFRTGVVSLTGVNSANPIGGSGSLKNVDLGTTTNMAITVTVQGTSGLVVAALMGTRTNNGDGNAKSPSTQLEKWTGNFGAGTGNVGGMSYLAHTGSDTTMEWENLLFNSSAADQIMYAVELLPAPYTPQMIIL